jgi:SPP1 gp7 family putative phage head morphogenesis protein
VSPIEQELARQRARLHAIEQKQTSEIIRAYSAVNARLAHHLDALTRDIENAQRAGTEVRPGWLFAQARYRQLIADLAEHTDAFIVKATGAVTLGQREAVQAAVDDGRRLARLALGPAPQGAVAAVTSTWDHLPTAALDRLIGRASDGGPLGALIRELAPLAPEKVRDTLAFGVAAGKNPRVIAREVHGAALITRHRALVIARTEIVGAHREASTETWRQTKVVKTWTWLCAKDRRTCASCWAQDGTEHPLDEVMATHPQCRCSKVPTTLSWADLGFPGIKDARPVIPTGPDAFEQLPDADKLAVLGRAKLDAYNNGDITLQDLVHPTRSPRWGNGSREATLREALA